VDHTPFEVLFHAFFVENLVISFVARFCKAGQAIIVRKNCDVCKLLDACPVGASAVLEAGSLCPFALKSLVAH